MSTRKTPVDSLAAYLRRAGLAAEAALAAQGDPANQLELALSRQKAKLPLSPELGEMEQLFLLLFGASTDLETRHHRFGPGAVEGLLLHLKGATDLPLLERGLAELQSMAASAPAVAEPLVDWLAGQRSSIPRTTIETKVDQLARALLDGNAVLLLAGAARALTLAAEGWPIRTIEEPKTEGVIRGPRQGFTEAIFTNTALIRSRIRNERLRFETTRIGELTGTRVTIAYIAGLCQPTLLDEVRQRLGRIKVDAILESCNIEELIEDTTWTVFPLVKATERPDVVCASLLEGRIAILTDGTPFALSVPTTFNEMMQSPEDYFERFPIVLLIRVLRWLFASIALLGPAFYVAFTTFHQEMLPHPLLLSILNAREGVPFPAVIEALMMEIAFEALREAGIRMPKQIGQAISIVGALVIGQAAVQAGLISAPMVIVVSLTGLASFVVPKFSEAVSLRLLRFVMLITAGTFGAFGLTLAVLCILVHLISLRSFGAPYYAPMAPLIPDDLDDHILRAPLWMNRKRPSTGSPRDRTRVKKGLGPQNRMPVPGEEEKP
ncbi:MAG: gerKA2 [Symbiobacteriaceae bacterium]|jgi:spore germination protein KA|nr:gerKA2 [Symbiobacteriaceae bacterium]